MSIIPNKKLVFIKITKTGCFSFSNILKPKLYICKKALVSLNPKLYSNTHAFHFTLKEFMVVAPQIKDYYKVAIVRNPYARLVSEYIHMKNKLCKSKLICNANATFHEFILAIKYKWGFLENEASQGLKCRFCTQKEYLINENKDIAVDRIFRYENYFEVEAFLKDTFGQGLVVPRKHYFGERPHFSHFYTKETQDIVKDLYKDDFETFGY